MESAAGGSWVGPVSGSPQDQRLPGSYSFCLPSSSRSVCATWEGRGRKGLAAPHPASVSAERDGPRTLKAAGEQVWLPRGAWRKLSIGGP